MMNEKFSIPAAGGIIRKIENNQEFILLQDRVKPDYKSTSGIIEIPAGKIREFENIFSCLKREVFEETGLAIDKIEGEDTAEVIKIKDYEVLSYTPFSSCQNLKGSYPIMVQVFICTVKHNEISIEESSESQNIRWIPVDKLRILLKEHPEQFFPMHIGTLRKYCDKVEL